MKTKTKTKKQSQQSFFSQLDSRNIIGDLISSIDDLDFLDDKNSTIDYAIRLLNEKKIEVNEKA